jgi:hypothetical protein
MPARRMWLEARQGEINVTDSSAVECGQVRLRATAIHKREIVAARMRGMNLPLRRPIISHCVGSLP